MDGFLKQNFWNLIITFAAIIISWATLSNKLEATATLARENKKAIVQYSNLVERIIVLEEARKNSDTDISEIKTDIKDIKKHFEIPDSK